MFQAIAPFFPLGQRELQEIARRKLQGEWFRQLFASAATASANHPPQDYDSHFPEAATPQVVVQDAFVQALVDPSRVEYIEWRRKGTDLTPLLTFSRTGAKVLDPGSPLVNKLLSQLQRCVATIIIINNNNVKCGQDEIHSLDYQARRGILRCCPKSSDVLAIGKEEACRKVCDFPL
jgi:hypothetical protein